MDLKLVFNTSTKNSTVNEVINSNIFKIRPSIKLQEVTLMWIKISSLSKKTNPLNCNEL